MAWTQAQVDKLKNIVVSGAQSVRNGDTSVAYHAPGELLPVIAAAQGEVDKAAGTRKRRVTKIYSTKGL